MAAAARIDCFRVKIDMMCTRRGKYLRGLVIELRGGYEEERVVGGGGGWWGAVGWRTVGFLSL